jgi:allantoin racemase
MSDPASGQEAIMRLAYIVVDDIAPDAAELERLTRAGQKLMPGDSTFRVIPAGFGPTVYYESAVGAALCVPALLHNVAELNGDCDAMLIGCFLDPGLRAAREISNVPVYGGGEACMLLSQFLARRFGIVTIEDTNIPEIAEYVTALHLADRCVGINSVSLPYYALVRDVGETLRRLEDRALPLLNAGAEAIVLGCMSFGFYPFADELAARLGVPVLDGVRSGIAAATAMSVLGMRHSARWLPPVQDKGAMNEFLGRLASAAPGVAVGR